MALKSKKEEKEVKGAREVRKIREESRQHKINPSLTFAVFLIILMLLIGTIVFHYNEGWDWVDSFYVSGLTVTTLGHEGLAPTRDSTKLFTVFYVIITFGLFLYSVHIIASSIIKRELQLLSLLTKRRR